MAIVMYHLPTYEDKTLANWVNQHHRNYKAKCNGRAQYFVVLTIVCNTLLHLLVCSNTLLYLQYMYQYVFIATTTQLTPSITQKNASNMDGNLWDP